MRRSALPIFAVAVAVLVSLVSHQDVRGQGFIRGGNTVSGYVYGIRRSPLAEANVELLDDLHRSIRRTKTNGSGYYEFRGFPQGRYAVRVYAFGTEYEEQEIEFEIQNFLDPNGRTTGFADEQRDFYMKLRPGVTAENLVVFVQDVPPEAEKLYKKAVADLDDQRTTEGLAELRSAIEIFPKYYFALERLANEYLGMGSPASFEAAGILFDSAVQINPRSYKSWYGLAYAKYATGNNEAAKAAIDKALEINPELADGYFLNGAILRRQKKFTDAEKQLLKALALGKNNMPQVHRELGLLYGNDLQKYPEAAKELRAYLKARPHAKDAEDLRKLIETYETKGK
jgi:tetratricopeptide (TPR) repeat protein